MAKFFLILTILLTGAAAFFGFQTKTKIGAIQQTVTNAKKDAADAKQSLSKIKDDAKAAQKQVADANEMVATAKSELSAAKTAADKAIADAAAATAKADGLQKDLDAANEKLKTVNPAPVNAANPAEIAALEQKVKEAEASAQEAKLNLQTLQSQMKEKDDKIAALAKVEQAHKLGVMKPGLEGQVMAVSPAWNFVVISLGDRQGAVANANLIIKRGDNMIGRVKITSVEPSTSIADIVADSVPKGQRVLPGDRVVYPAP